MKKSCGLGCILDLRFCCGKRQHTRKKQQLELKNPIRGVPKRLYNLYRKKARKRFLHGGLVHARTYGGLETGRPAVTASLPPQKINESSMNISVQRLTAILRPAAHCKSVQDKRVEVKRRFTRCIAYLKPTIQTLSY